MQTNRTCRYNLPAERFLHTKERFLGKSYKVYRVIKSYDTRSTCCVQQSHRIIQEWINICLVVGISDIKSVEERATLDRSLWRRRQRNSWLFFDGRACSRLEWWDRHWSRPLAALAVSPWLVGPTPLPECPNMRRRPGNLSG